MLPLNSAGEVLFSSPNPFGQVVPCNFCGVPVTPTSAVNGDFLYDAHREDHGSRRGQRHPAGPKRGHIVCPFVSRAIKFCRAGGFRRAIRTIHVGFLSAKWIGGPESDGQRRPCARIERCVRIPSFYWRALGRRKFGVHRGHQRGRRPVPGHRWRRDPNSRARWRLGADAGRRDIFVACQPRQPRRPGRSRLAICSRISRPSMANRTWRSARPSRAGRPIPATSASCRAARCSRLHGRERRRRAAEPSTRFLAPARFWPVSVSARIFRWAPTARSRSSTYSPRRRS